MNIANRETSFPALTLTLSQSTGRGDKRGYARRKGIALVLVVLVMALATILAYAMLSGSAVQATAAGNAVAAATAQAQAESGIHLAMFYILNQNDAPANFFNSTTSNITFATTSPAATIPGSVTIVMGAPAIGANGVECFPVTAIGSSGSSMGGGAVTRTITAEICAGSTYQINQAAAFNTAVTLSASETFSSANSTSPAMVSTGGVLGSGVVSGNIEASSVSLGTVQTNGSVSGAPTTPASPNSGTVANFAAPYVYQGVQYNATQLGATVNSAISYGPTPSNPLGIYYTTGSLTVNKALTINGTLVVPGTLMPVNAAVNVTPVTTTLTTNYPAIVVGSKLTLDGSAASVNATGVVYVTSGITGLSSTSATSLTVNGALMVTGGGITSYSGKMSVTYNPAYTNIPNFASSNTTPCVKIISWSE